VERLLDMLLDKCTVQVINAKLINSIDEVDWLVDMLGKESLANQY
jgi:hypothetical protein